VTQQKQAVQCLFLQGTAAAIVVQVLPAFAKIRLSITQRAVLGCCDKYVSKPTFPLVTIPFAEYIGAAGLSLG
jgi:hypothetical protein